jgi:hypothetical protein
MNVRVRWTHLNDMGHELWRLRRGLYSYWSSARELLYVGKVDGTTIKQRWNYSGKSEFWEYLRRRKIPNHSVLAGEITLDGGLRLSQQMLADVEGLLINRLSPGGNIMSINSRTRRPGLVVRCTGLWPVRTRIFRDG